MLGPSEEGEISRWENMEEAAFGMCLQARGCERGEESMKREPSRLQEAIVELQREVGLS